MEGRERSDPLSEVKHEEGLFCSDLATFLISAGPKARKAERPPRIVPRKAKRTDVRAGV